MVTQPLTVSIMIVADQQSNDRVRTEGYNQQS